MWDLLMNDRKLKGEVLQKAALQAFNLGDYYAALPLYAEAEDNYRAAFGVPGDRVFFMQASGVRCLGEMVEQRPGFIELYRSEAKRFLGEWTDSEIKSKISTSRVEEAIAFSSWITTGLGSNFFYDAYVAAGAGQFSEARALIRKAIGELPEHPERNAMTALARASIERFFIDEEMAKRRIDRNLRDVAKFNLQAARVLRLPAKTISRQAEAISRRRYVALSEALKWRATERLNRHSASNDVALAFLTDAERFLKRAENYSRIAHSKGTASNLLSIQVTQLSYAYLTVRVRGALMRFMLSADEEQFNTAMQAWKQAVETVNVLPKENKLNLFPRRFYSIEDLKLEELFLKAAKAFRNEQWLDCIDFLQEWIDRFPLEYRWSWRYSNVMVRLLGASVIANIYSEQVDRAAMRQQVQALDEFARSEPIGRAGRYFATEIVRLDQKRAAELKNSILHELCAYFPLDSITETYDRPRDTDLFQSLPSRIARGLSQPTATTQTQFEAAKVEFLASIEALLGYICDYDAQWSPTAIALPEPNIRSFLHFCKQFGWARKTQSERALNDLEVLVAQCEATSSAKEFSSLYEQGRQVVLKLLKFVPLRVSIETRYANLEQQDYVETSPDWCLDQAERNVIRVSVKSLALLPIEPGEYYLPPLWRTGTRYFYLVDPQDNNPLFPVRFKPRWDYWERALRNTLFWLPNGVAYHHLERAIELAAQSVPDDDDRPSPKVGALILKQGKVVAEAYRNEFGQTANMHAEETALDKCKKQDLTGAVAITTLEPCVAGRRHSKTTCAHLLLQAGIEHVVIGMLDPNPSIRGTSEGLFSKNKVSVYYFPTELRSEIRSLNEEFIEIQEKGQYRTIHHFQAHKD